MGTSSGECEESFERFCSRLGEENVANYCGKVNQKVEFSGIITISNLVCDKLSYSQTKFLQYVERWDCWIAKCRKVDAFYRADQKTGRLREFSILYYRAKCWRG